eukprot:2636055-Rhodomonas_salina.1
MVLFRAQDGTGRGEAGAVAAVPRSPSSPSAGAVLSQPAQADAPPCCAASASVLCAGCACWEERCACW